MLCGCACVCVLAMCACAACGCDSLLNMCKVLVKSAGATKLYICQHNYFTVVIQYVYDYGI